MTNLEKRIKLEDVLGNKYYNYNLTSSNYNPSLNGSITITCIVTNTLGDAVSGKSLQLFKNGVSLGASYNKTTNSNGVATWSIVCNDAGLQTYSIDIEEIEILVDNKADINHSHSYNDLTNKPTIPTKTSDLDNDSNFLTSHQSLNNYVTTDDSRLSDARTPTSHNHTTGEVTDTSAYSNIGSNANATQKTINNNINTVLGNKANSNNVYSKSETYTQSEITTAISSAVSELTLFEVVSTLPTTNIKNNRLYLIANNENISDNLYDVYLYVNNNWELLDKLEFDISNYYTKSETDTLLGGKVNTSDSRLTDSRTPKSHSHGDITNTGTIGSTANKPLITGSNGKITTGSFGTTANTFVEGNDSRLSDARTPTSHTHSSSEITDLSIPNINGKEDSSNKVNSWSVTTTDEHYPSEKLVKSSLDNKVDKENGKGLFSGSYNDLSDKPTIPTKTSDLNNDSNFITSHQDISGKEDISNKSSNITSDTGSISKYPTVKAVEDYAEPKQEAGTFTELIALINNTPAGKTITLDKDYINSEGLTGSTTFNNEIHIDGNGHILDFDYKNYSFTFNGEKSSIENWIVEHFQYTIFAIVFKNIIIDNCIFRNSSSNLQSINSLIGTSSNATNFLMVNCQFYNIQASSLQLINLNGSKQYIKNCIFYNNLCNNVIFSNRGDKQVNNTVSCVFENNRVYDGVIKHNGSGNKNTIVDCIFNNSIALSGNGSAINCKETTILINNKFITSNDTVYPTTLINKDYLIEHQDISGKVDTIDLGEVAFSNDYEDLDNLPTIPSAYTHPTTHPSSMITDSNTHSNIGNTANTLENIITNIDTKLGSLANVDLIEVTSSLGTASANTMNKLYLVAETTGATNDNYEIFVTVRTGTSGNYSYNWEKVDATRIDLSNYLTTANAQQTYVAKENGKGLSSNDYTTSEKNKLAGLHTVATSGSYNDLADKPTIPTVPTTVSSFTNDSGYLTSQDISGKEDISNKSSSITTDTGSTSKYPTIKAIEDYAVQKIPMGDVYGTPSNPNALQQQIQNASSGNIIVLDKDYLNNSNATHISVSNKNVAIMGNGHIIDGNNKLITFNASGTTTLKISNCVFQNFTIPTGQAMFRATDSAKIILDNCIFKNIKIKTYTGIINTDQSLGNHEYTNAEIKILNSSFLSITGSTFLNFYDTNFSIINTIFENNATNSILVNNTSSTNFTQEIINCVFNNNYPAITDSSTGVKSLVLKNNHFLQSGDTITGCVNNNYLTQHQDISGKVNTVDLSNVAISGSYDDLTDKPTIPSAYTHPTELSSALTTSSLYKIKANTKGHITEATSVGIDTTNGGTSGSSSLITSGAVYTGLDGKANSNHNHNSLVGESGLTLIEDDYNNNLINALNNKLIYDYGLSDIIYYDRDGTGFNYLDYSNEVAIKGDIPTDVSDLTDTSNTAFTPKTHNHGNITNDGKCSTTGTVDVSRGDLLLFADATSGANQYTIKGSTFVDALNDLILDLIDEGE